MKNEDSSIPFKEHTKYNTTSDKEDDLSALKDKVGIFLDSLLEPSHIVEY